MTLQDYFHKELHVHFTRSEINTIMSALALTAMNDTENGRKELAQTNWTLRKKVAQFAELYDNSEIF